MKVHKIAVMGELNKLGIRAPELSFPIDMTTRKNTIAITGVDDRQRLIEY